MSTNIDLKTVDGFNYERSTFDHSAVFYIKNLVINIKVESSS